jgi:hypothetical protein
MNIKGCKLVQSYPDMGMINSAWIKMLVAAHDELGGNAYEEWPYLTECVCEIAVDRKHIRPLVDESFKRYGFLYLAAVARFVNPAGVGSIFTGMMNAPTLRHGIAYLAFESARLDSRLTYNFSNYDSRAISTLSSWVIEWEYGFKDRHQQEASHVVQVAGMIKYFGMLHGEPPRPSDVWVELDLPYEDSFLLEKALGVPVSFTGKNCIHVSETYARRESLHSFPDTWAAIALEPGAGFTSKAWADRLSMAVSCWDYSTGRPTVESVAEQLNLTGATLRNRLKPEYVVKDVMKGAEMKRVRNSLRNGMKLADAQKTYGYSNLRDLKIVYKKYIGEGIEKAKRSKVKDTRYYK